MPTTGSVFLEALRDAGVSYIFANLGSDHPALIEAIAEARARGTPIPSIVTCPNEMVALTCAQGYTQITGRAQAVVVHVDCGTQALAGAVHNVARCRVPVLIFAGLSPFTQEGELAGSRNEFIQWIQDVHDQRGIVREYVKYSTEIRTGRNLQAIVRRAMQIAHSAPQGPVYLVAAREVMEEQVPERPPAPPWNTVSPAALPEAEVRTIVDALAGARRPLVVTSYLGARPAAVASLRALCSRLAIGVLESVPNAMNYPHDDELYQGCQWNEPRQNPVLADADVILVLDSDVPWIPRVSKPRDGATIFHIDVDPLKMAMPLWYINASRSFNADASTALAQLVDYAATLRLPDAVIIERRHHYAGLHRRRVEKLEQAARPGSSGIITAEFFTAALRREIDDDTIVLNEGITNYPVICDYIAPRTPGTFFNSGGGSLGWNGGAAIGMKLARPDQTVVALSGDGSYMFTVPSSVHWMARRYGTPFLQVVYNNRGWKAPKFSTLAVHPDGYASRAKDLDLSFDPPPDYGGIAAAAGGAYARQIKTADEVEPAIREALAAVRTERRAAVLDVWLDQP